MSSAAPMRFQVRERIELQRGVAGVDDGPDLLHHAFVGAEVAAVRVGVEQDVVAHLAAEQLVDRLAQHLAADVPQRDVDAADHVGRGAARAGVGERAERLVPEPLDLRRVLADQQLVELADDARDSAVGDPGRRGDLAPAGDALVGADLDEEVFAPEVPSAFTSHGTSFVIFMASSPPPLGVRWAAAWASGSHARIDNAEDDGASHGGRSPAYSAFNPFSVVLRGPRSSSVLEILSCGRSDRSDGSMFTRLP